MDTSARERLGLVIIGRNEGQRLADCLASVRGIAKCVYVDSGSTDSSVALARSRGLDVVELPEPPNFTAARARNAGLEQLLAGDPELEYVQMIDGDCEMQSGWIEAALAALTAASDLAAVIGRRRERYPERSVYNALCDDEWNLPLGEVPGCGGDALFRIAAIREAGLYNPMMIAGEDSELSMRMRKCGWRLYCINHEMTVHDAGITRLGQWWRRAQRSGHGFGEMAFLHPDARNPNWPRSVRSILFWGGVMPLLLIGAIISAVVVDPLWWFVASVLLLAWPVRMIQLAGREQNRGLPAKVARASGILMLLGKVAQFQGLMGYYRGRLLGRASKLIEYKGSSTT